MYAINPLSTEAIATLDDRELETRFRDIQRAINKVKNPQKRISLEEEFCYLYREREVRANRIRIHKEYLSRRKAEETDYDFNEEAEIADVF